MSKGGLVVWLLTGTPVSADQAQAGAVLAGPEIAAFDLARLATIACLTHSGALVASVGLCSRQLVLFRNHAIPFA